MTEDLAPFFADFAVDATVNGAAVRGIFDNGFALGAVGIGMAGTQPTLRLRTADVAADPVGQAVVVGAVSYTVAAHEPDGTGVSVLMLERA
jgi:hypothetical protein